MVGMRGKLGKFIVITLVCLGIDQYTKLWIDRNFELHQSLKIIDGLFNLTYIRNPGAAFGFLANSESSWVTPFFITVAILALGVLLYVLKEVDHDDHLAQIALALIFGGALGNLVDRIAYKEVIDFLDFYWGTYHWPAFNVADSAITVGAVLYLWAHIKSDYLASKNEKAEENENSSP